MLHHDEVFADPQILARGMVAEVEHAKAGKQKTLGVPIKMSATPGGVRRAAPTLGQHDAELKKKKGKAEEGKIMVRTAGVLAALALMPAAASAQNGYSFLDSAQSPVHYNVARHQSRHAVRGGGSPRLGVR